MISVAGLQLIATKLLGSTIGRYLLLALAAGAVVIGAYKLGEHKGAQETELRTQLALARAEAAEYKRQAEAMNEIARRHAARWLNDTAKETSFKEMLDAIPVVAPSQDGACLDAAATERLRRIR